jgi:hypothetical protein
VRILAVSVAATLASLSVTASLRASGTPATSLHLGSPTAAIPTVDGGYLIADEKNCVVYKVSSGGTSTLVAGTGICDHFGDGGAATAARIAYPNDAVPTSDGGFLIAESGGTISFGGFTFPSGGVFIDKVSSTGKFTTAAGGLGRGDYTGDGGPATSAGIDAVSVVPFHAPGAAVPTPGSGFLLADAFNCVIRKVDGSGTISTVAGDGVCGVPNAFFGAESCPSTTLCVATGSGQFGASDGGNAVVTGNPSGGSSATWSIKGNVDPRTYTEDQVPSLGDVACVPGGSLCVAPDSFGNVVSSTNPGAGADATWAVKSVTGDQTNGLAAISCPASNLCVASNYTGDIWTSTNAGNGSTSTWTELSGIDPNNIIEGISCPSTLRRRIRRTR